jgi:hypothetical protein
MAQEGAEQAVFALTFFNRGAVGALKKPMGPFKVTIGGPKAP